MQRPRLSLPGGSGCTIGGQSYPALSINALDPAQCCNPALSATDWTPLFVKTMTTPVASDTINGPNDELVADLNGPARRVRNSRRASARPSAAAPWRSGM